MTTKVTGLLINRTNELMVGWSQWKNSSLKMIHLKSGTVYKNWPNLTTRLSKI